MNQLPAVTPEYFQILVVRELRKVGFDVGTVRIHRRSELPEPEHGFVLELAVSLTCAGKTWRALVACRHQTGAVEREVIEAITARLPQVPSDMALVFATADFGVETIAAAQAARIALLHVADSRSVYDASGWSTPGHYPAWLPSHLAQVVDLDAGGQIRIRALEAGRAGTEMILAGRGAPA